MNNLQVWILCEVIDGVALKMSRVAVGNDLAPLGETLASRFLKEKQA
jgi:hypothetical protein